MFSVGQWLWPPPLPVIGPLSSARVDQLNQQWQSTTGRRPSQAELQPMVQIELDRDMLFQEGLSRQLYRYDPVIHQRLVLNMHFLGLAEDQDEAGKLKEALRLNLHLGDEVIRGRIIQLVQQILVESTSIPPVVESDIVTAFKSKSAEHREPRKYSIKHLYLPVERAAEVENLKSLTLKDGFSFDDAKPFSAPFLQGYEFANKSPVQLAQTFGSEFVNNFEALQPLAGAWVGPVSSTFGFHMVWVEAIKSARDLTLEEVRQPLQRDLELERRRLALQAAVADLRERYEVML